MFKIYDGREEFYQWDSNQKLIVRDPSINEVHFCNRTDECSLVCEVYEEEGARLVNVPNILLQTDWTIRVYAFCTDHTKTCKTFKVNARTKPADYAYTETEVRTWNALEERVTYLEEHGGAGGAGADGGYYIPAIDTEGNLSWSGSKEGMEPIDSVNIKGDKGDPGEPGKDGAPGADYVLTDDDKAEIAALTLELLPDAEEVSY